MLAITLALQDVTLAALYVSTKMHDTLKKPRELLMVSYAVRFPEQAAKSKSIAGEIDMDPAVRLLSLTIQFFQVLLILSICRGTEKERVQYIL